MVDSHCHLYEIAEEEWKENGLEAMICAGADLESSKMAIELASKYENVHATVGIHPEGNSKFEILNSKQNFKSQLLNLTKNKKVVAVGECGLDYKTPSRSPFGHLEGEQKELFNFHVDLAKEANLPLVVHNRNAFDDIFEMLDYDRVQMHCFTGNEEQMRECIKRGWYISFGGIITFKKSEELRSVARLVPEDRILVETDSPYLAPEPVRGTKNSPANVKYVIEMIAQTKKASFNQIEKITTGNAVRLFGLDPSLRSG